MSASQSITEMVILHLKEDGNLEAIKHDMSSNTDTITAAQAFTRGLNTGHQVEDPRVFVWSIDWESVDHHTAFADSGAYKPFLSSLGRAFDFEKAAPLQTFTHFTSDATTALAAPVTEVAFYTVPDSVREQAKAMIEEMSVSSTHPVITVGKSSGGAVGWVSKTLNAGDTVSEDQSIALLGVFGYDSTDDHVKWRQTPEHAQVIEEMTKSPLSKLGLGEPNLPGEKIFVPDSSMFHVRFRIE